MTLHTTTGDIDGGNYVHQTKINPEVNHGIHDNACLAVKNFCDEIPELINKNWKKIDHIKPIKPKTTGRIWTSKMWSPFHLKIIYEFYNDKINEFCLKNKVKTRDPVLKSILT